MVYKGKINSDFLNVRVFGATIKGSPEDVPFSKGESVDIIKAVYGDSIEGNDIWYQLETEEFIWSGYVDLEEELSPKTKKIIFTADDFGVIDSIDEGVKDAAIAGYLKSVTCFVNYNEENQLSSLERIKELHQLSEANNLGLELGIHLTATSGKPIITDNNLLLDDGYFHDFTKIHKKYKKAKKNNEKDLFLEQMKGEFNAQIKAFKELNIPLRHLTTHHNIHLFNTDFFKVFIAVAQENAIDHKAIPVRSINNRPAWKDKGYQIVKGKQYRPFKSMKEIEYIFKGSKGTIETPEMLHSNHYGPLPFQKKYGASFRSLIDNKKVRLIDMINELRWGKEESMEFLLHLRKPKASSLDENHKAYKKEVEIEYSGINPLAFDSRAAEFKSLTESLVNTDALPKGVILGKWKDL